MSDEPEFWGCDCDAYDGDHDSTCAIYVQPQPTSARTDS